MKVEFRTLVLAFLVIWYTVMPSGGSCG